MIRLALLFGLAAATALPAAPARAATPKDALVIAWNLDALITFDPAQIGEVNGNQIIDNVCDSLVRYKPDDISQIVPWLAKSWTVSADGRVITFTLRPDLAFPDGSPATAGDAAWTLQRAVLLGFGTSADLTQWGFTKANVTDAITAPDDHTLVVRMDKPYPVNLILSALFAHNIASIMDRKVAEAHAKVVDGQSDYGNAFFKTGPVCVGPYRVTRWDADQDVILEANPHYWGSKPGLSRVILRHVPESGAERLLLQKGDVDIAELLNSDDLKALADDPHVHIVQTLLQQMSYLAMNTTDPILAKPQVRLAFRYLIDYDALGHSILQYLGKPRASLVPEGAFGALDDKAGEPFSLDPAKAKQLITEAGYPDGFETHMILSANGVSPAVAQSIAANAAKIGIKIDLEQMADANLFTRGRARNFQIQLVGWGTGYPDADAMISRHAVDPDSRPEAKLAQYPVWRTGWEDAGVNKTAEEARMEPDPAKRIALYHQLQDYMMQNGPMAYIYQGIRSLGVRDEVKGLQLNAFNVDYWSATK